MGVPKLVPQSPLQNWLGGTSFAIDRRNGEPTHTRFFRIITRAPSGGNPRSAVPVGTHQAAASSPQLAPRHSAFRVAGIDTGRHSCRRRTSSQSRR
jgi:hypothetical protein